MDEGKIKNIVTDVVKDHLSDYVNLGDFVSKQDFSVLEDKHNSLSDEYEEISVMVINLIGQIIEKLEGLSHS